MATNGVYARYLKKSLFLKKTFGSEMHPKATVPTHQSLAFTQVDYTFGPSWATISAQIAGDFVAIMIRECEGLTCTYIEIWNWTQADLPHKVCALCQPSDSFSWTH